MFFWNYPLNRNQAFPIFNQAFIYFICFYLFLRFLSRPIPPHHVAKAVVCIRPMPANKEQEQEPIQYIR